MNKQLLSLFTRTPLHVGAGSSVGAIDQPVVRERHTRFPVIPGSSIKGVLADLWPSEGGARSADAARLFGSDDCKNAFAGKLLVGEGRLLAFPVRSAKGCFAWLTCPLTLNRFLRDSNGSFASEISNLKLAAEEVCVTEGSALVVDGKVIFEEYPLAVKGKIGAALVNALKAICADNVWQELPKRLAVVSDDLFAYFAEHACEVAQHIKIDDATGTTVPGALFNQENVPSEALFYAVMQAQEADVLAALDAKLAENDNLIQLGADETTGLGWCSVKLNVCK